MGHILSVNRAIKITFILLVILGAFFIGYYAWDQQHRQSVSAMEQDEQRIEQLLRDNPSDPNSWIALGSNALQQKKFDKAISAYQSALSLNAGTAVAYSAYIGLGTACMEKGVPQQAINSFGQALILSEDPNFIPTATSLATVNYYLGKIYLEKGDPNQATQYLIESLNFSPTNADTIFLLGKVYEAEGNITGAEAIYLRALSLVPNFTEVYSQLGGLYLSQGDEVKAAYNQAMASLFSGSVADAVAELQTVVTSMTDNANAYWGLGWGYEKMNLRDKAIAAYQEAVKIDPNHRLAKGALSRLGASNT